MNQGPCTRDVTFTQCCIRCSLETTLSQSTKMGKHANKDEGRTDTDVKGRLGIFHMRKKKNTCVWKQ